MCGIFGIVQPGAKSEKLVSLGERANVLQVHRGPDQAGKAGGEGWLLAHRRLAIFDVSPEGKQPMFGNDGSVIVFNGAIYNFPELKSELTASGHRFSTGTDTEVILAAYSAWGTDCFARFNGMWAIAIIDPKRRELVLSRDRYGIKPLYLFNDGEKLAFASETFTLRSTVAHNDQLNHDVAGDFLLHGWQDHRSETLWAGIRQFPIGHFSIYSLDDLRRLRHEVYYTLPAKQIDNNEGDLKRTLKELFSESVHLRTRSDVGCGLTLSGGIDSSAIAGLLGPENTTYSVRFPGTPYDESTYIDAVLGHRKLKNKSLVPSWEDFVRDHQACNAAQDQPLASAAVVVHYSMMSMISAAGETVLLNGQGADEIGAGYDKFYLPFLKERFRDSFASGLSAGFGVAKNIRLGPDKIVSRLQRVMAPLAPTTFLAPALSAQIDFIRTPDFDVRQTSINLLTEVGLPNLLRHEDRNAMAHSIESRTPFLDYRMVDFLLTAPANFKVRNGIRKWGIRESLRDVLAPEVYSRKRKLGFATPQVNWMSTHPQFFLGTIKRYVRSPDALLLTTTAEFAESVLLKRQLRFYPLVWRWWAWSSFFDASQIRND